MGLSSSKSIARVFAALLLLSACSGPSALSVGPSAGTAAHGRATIPGCAQPSTLGARCLLASLRRAAGPEASGFGPPDFQARYQLPSWSKGSEQVVAIVDAYDNPNAASDLATYRTKYGLGTANFTKYNQRGQTGNYPSGSTGWGVEIDLDVEMVSASCPLCSIYLIEADSASASDLSAAEREAVKLGARIVSNSWGCSGSGNCARKKDFDAKGVVYLASGAGELGAPAYFDTVVSVGGTTLAKNGSQYSESVWSGSPGGCATPIKKPKWQRDHSCAHRLANDVSAVANDVALYDSYGYGGWASVSGTSVSAPLLAGVFGLAGNAARQKGGRTFWLTGHRADLYALEGSCSGYGYGQYTTCGGWGSPNGIGAF